MRAVMNTRRATLRRPEAARGTPAHAACCGAVQGGAVRCGVLRCSFPTATYWVGKEVECKKEHRPVAVQKPWVLVVVGCVFAVLLTSNSGVHFLQRKQLTSENATEWGRTSLSLLR